MIDVGTKVVCIEKFKDDPVIVRPVKGETYTVRGFERDGVNVGLWLREIVNKPCNLITRDGRTVCCEQSFNINCFRPLVDKPTDISVFKKLLEPKAIPTEVREKEILDQGFVSLWADYIALNNRNVTSNGDGTITARFGNISYSFPGAPAPIMDRHGDVWFQIGDWKPWR